MAAAEDVHLGEGSRSETEGHEVVGPHERGPEKATLRVGVFFYTEQGVIAELVNT